MSEPARLLEQALLLATSDLHHPLIDDQAVAARVEFVCRCLRNRAGVRLLLACLLAKVHRPEVDPRKPYTEIGSADAFSGRSYDEQHITPFVNKYRLPCNTTTAFLTPALRNIDRPLTTDVVIIGRPRQLYTDVLQLLQDVQGGHISAMTLLAETVRYLLLIRDEQEQRMATLLAGLRHAEEAPPLSSEEIVRLLEQHLQSKNSSRLPVLMVAAAYQVVGQQLGERLLPLRSHNAADEQTGAMGDVEVCLISADQVVTAYEMKMKRVTVEDINRALQKVAAAPGRIHNYLFVTTEVVEETVRRYAAESYEKTGGTEIAILDCLGFVRHFLHFFHRLRIKYLDAYQELLLTEPDSAVSRPLKEALLALRQVAEADT